MTKAETDRMNAMEKALRVFVYDHAIRDWMAQNDPKALEQACEALGGRPHKLGGWQVDGIWFNTIFRPMIDADLRENGIEPGFQHTQLRESYVDWTIDAYTRAQAERTPEQIAEQRAEARAAHGPGVELVNVVTGERYTT